jgi:pimeloyl-ACP methyl ester carboxylesterase
VSATRLLGGDGPVVVLLHGLAGHAGEWTQTAGWLSERYRVLALDARGHGVAERAPRDVSREAHVADVVDAIERLEVGRVIVVGQSLGGHTAMLVAARRPDLVQGLVMVEASPAGGNTEVADELGRALRRWPVPFPSSTAALEFFGGPSQTAEAWVDGLEERDGGWWPRFDVDVMVQTLREAVTRSYWDEWDRIRCPTLVVRAGAGTIPAADAEAMVARLPQARLVEIEGAAHDVHLDRPMEWREALTEFLRSEGL